jgi:hypothetical protein
VIGTYDNPIPTCDRGPQDWVGGQDCLHPDDSGYAKVAAAFLDVLVAG